MSVKVLKILATTIRDSPQISPETANTVLSSFKQCILNKAIKRKELN